MSYWTPNPYTMSYGGSASYTPMTGYNSYNSSYPGYSSGWGNQYGYYSSYGNQYPYYYGYYPYMYDYNSFMYPDEPPKEEKHTPSILTKPAKVITKITEENVASGLTAFFTGLSMGAIPALINLVALPIIIKNKGGTWGQGIRTALSSSLVILAIGGTAGVMWTFRDKFKKIWKQIQQKFNK